MLAPRTQELASYWASAAVFDANTRQEIAHLIETKNAHELEERFYRDLEFGTGGLRGILGAGSARMNVYNVRKASCALAAYVKESFPHDKDLRIAISYDSRRFSREFAQSAAEVFAAHGITAMLTKELRPTPMLSFMVRHFKCHAGICVTASHNPPNYNGYKVYWQTGGQLVAPHDAEVIKRYLAIKSYEDIPTIPYQDGMAAKKIIEVGADFDEIYFKKVAELSLRPEGRDNFKIVYSPLHGTGGYPVTEMLKRFGFKHVLMVPEQAAPNGDFPTVKYPNPEEPEALALAVALAQKEQADLVLATDPDSDRIGIVVREKGKYLFLNGNQIGCLLVEYFLSGLKAAKRLPKDALVIKTIVTTDLQRDIAEHYGAQCDETLTGFKWICQLIEDYETGKIKPYKKYVCGGEESFGFLADSFVRDKDAVSGCAIAAEMVAYYKSQGLTLTEVLDQLFKRHGVYQESLYTVTLPGKEGAERILRMMQSLRTNPPLQIDGVPVEKLRDFGGKQEFVVKNAALQKVNDLTLPGSNVLQFILSDGTKISARPSGTEPKIKFYVSVRNANAKGADAATIETIKADCSARVRRIEQTFVAIAEKA